MVVVGCSSAPTDQDGVPDAGPVRTTGFATAADGTRIEYLDYGGSGTPLVLLAGLGDTGAIFDGIAPELADEYRVVAITRRGFGASDQPLEGYDHATRVADDLAVLDALGIERAAFAGHSIAGDELGVLGSEHPDRVAGLVFLDAAADRTSPAPDGFLACEEEMRGYLPETLNLEDPYGSLMEWAEAQFGFPPPVSYLGEIKAETDIVDGGGVEFLHSKVAMGEIEKQTSTSSPDYAAISVPALSIHATGSTVGTTWPWMTNPAWPADARQRAQECAEKVAAGSADTVDWLRDTNPGIAVQEWDGFHHYLFLQDPQRTVDAMKEWLATIG